MTINVGKVSAGTLNAVQARGHSLDDVAAMSPREVFNEYCEWHGLVSWGDALWKMAEELKGAETSP